ncbi:MAG: flagellar assembly protein FliX [Alphaproteobacteria bacterium]
MVDIKVGGPAAAQGPDKKKAVTRPHGGTAFASLLDAASETDDAAPASSSGFANAYVPLDGLESDTPHPRNARDQAKDLLDTLQNLAEDILAGQPSSAAAKLEAALGVDVTDMANLSAQAKQVMDEISTRAAVAAAKMKS